MREASFRYDILGPKAMLNCDLPPGAILNCGATQYRQTIAISDLAKIP